jgi:hypothetical protein
LTVFGARGHCGSGICFKIQFAVFRSHAKLSASSAKPLPSRSKNGRRSAPGLPDGFFSDQKSQFGYILEDLGMENVIIYSGQLEYFTTIGYIIWQFDNFVVIWDIFPRFGT